MSRPRTPRWVHIAFSPIVLVLVVPLYFLIINAFKPQQAIVRDPFGIPWSDLTIRPLTEALAGVNGINVSAAYLTTGIITFGSVALTIAFAAPLGYVIARGRGRAANATFLFVIAGILVPSQVILIPAIQVLRATGLMFTMPGLLFANAAQYLAFATFIYVGFTRRLPRELDESAIVDGAGTFTTFWKVIFPLLRPPTASIAIILALWSWNDFLNPLLILGPGSGYTITSGMYRAIGSFTTNWEQVFSFLWLSSIPMLIVYLFLQRQFIAGLTEGGVKG